jgi:hypothetical protein
MNTWAFFGTDRIVVIQATAVEVCGIAGAQVRGTTYTLHSWFGKTARIGATRQEHSAIQAAD